MQKFVLDTLVLNSDSDISSLKASIKSMHWASCEDIPALITARSARVLSARGARTPPFDSGSGDPISNPPLFLSPLSVVPSVCNSAPNTLRMQEFVLDTLILNFEFTTDSNISSSKASIKSMHWASCEDIPALITARGASWLSVIPPQLSSAFIKFTLVLDFEFT
ncbi:hypothetical protein K438DRAFT_1766583 [Mycena galopus ATCC 62051]|nr:hypothetical protein K438DRAFT_1766583 [Mycena galopus ATCC 62051]